jgi:hypothetical protein
MGAIGVVFDCVFEQLVGNVADGRLDGVALHHIIGNAGFFRSHLEKGSEIVA